MQQQDNQVPSNYRGTTSATAGKLVGGLYTTATEVLPGFSQSSAAGTQALRALRGGATQAQAQRMAIAGAAVDSLSGGLLKGPAALGKALSKTAKKGKMNPAGILGQSAVDYLASEFLTGAVFDKGQSPSKPKVKK